MSLLRIAVPNKGSLAQSAADILRESGYRQRDDAKQLTLTDAENGVEFFYLRPRDIALYVGEGTLDVGITGRDLLRDSGAKADEVLPLGFGRSRFRFAGPAGQLHRRSTSSPARGSPRRTSGWSARSSQERGIEAEVVRLDGAVETSIQLGVADVIADVVETGSTLRAGRARGVRRDDPGVRGGADHPHGRRSRDRLRDLPAPGRGRPGGPRLRDDGLRHRARRTSPRAVALTPGIEGPTISPLHREGWVAVRAMVPRAGSQRLMDELYEIGARGILLTDIHACRL